MSFQAAYGQTNALMLASRDVTFKLDKSWDGAYLWSFIVGIMVNYHS